MKIFISFLSICLFCISPDTTAQNLVPNPGFETANRMPVRKGNSIARAKDWIPLIGGADYYVSGAGKYVGTPKNVFGRQKPHAGKAYAGICNRTDFLEYIAVKLTDTLIKDQEYLVEFYISRAERSIRSLKEFGVMFTDKIKWNYAGLGITAKPQVEFINRKGFKNKKKWTKLSAVYKAEGNESGLILGHFNYNDKKRWIYCHYYIDDISVTAIENKTDSAIIQNKKIPSPEDLLPEPGKTITLRNIFFETNKSELLSQSFGELDKLVKQLNEMPGTTITISGHTDNSGNEEKNKTLSEARARSVANYLISKGVDRSRVKYTGYGSSKPLVNNETEEGRQQNRRVEFTISR
jgi:OOP family OmpA-OmpF porin